MKSKMALEIRIDEDLRICEECLKNKNWDRNALDEIFNRLLLGYIQIIDGYSKGLNVVSPDCNQGTIRENIVMLRDRLSEFKDCGCDNEVLKERRLKTRIGPNEIRMMFCEARNYILGLEGLSKGETDEVISKIDEIEDICLSVDTAKNKWNRLRPYVMWTAGKSVGIALKIFPLFITIG